MHSIKAIACGKYLYSLLLCLAIILPKSHLQAQNLIASFSTYDFGIVSIGRTGSQYLVLTNTGATGSIEISDLNWSGADTSLFSATLTTLPVSIPPGGELSFFIAFDPSSSGAKSATLTIVHDGPNADIDIDLEGEGCEFILPGAGSIYVPTGDALKIEIEDQAATDAWVSYSGIVNSENLTFYTWEGGAQNGNPGAAGVLTYEFAIQSPGIYRFQVHSLQGDPGDPTEANDIWVKFTTGDVRAIQGDPTSPSSEIDLVDGDWFVAYKSSILWDWQTYTVFGNGHDIYVEFTQGGIYELQFSARSPGFSIDKFVLYSGSQDPDTIAFSGTGTEQACLDILWYLDADGDGYGNALALSYSDTQPINYVGNALDCDDNDAAAYPGNTEIEDGIDNNCDGEIDEGFLPDLPWYEDSDGDGYGNPDMLLIAQTQPTGYVDNADDCDDTDVDINPDATEIFDGQDNNCDGDVDEGFTIWYQDADGDGFGNPAVSTYAVGQPAGYVADNTDCDDTDGDIFPGNPEIDDNKDNNCNGDIDEGFTDWREISGFTGEPVGRHENSFVKVGDKFILIGGRSSDTKYVEIYDPATNAWTQGALHPMEMHHFQAVELDGLIYVIGAFTGDFPIEVGIRSIFIYDPSTDQWHQGPEMPSTRIRGSAASIAYEGKIYVLSGLIDGHRAGHVTWFDVFDPSTNTWIQLPDAPRARDHFHIDLWGDKIVVTAGRRSKYDNGGLHSALEDSIDVYDFSDSAWTTLPTLLPTVRAGASAAIIGDEVFVIGGESGSQQAAYVETEGLNLLNYTWTTYDPLIEGRHGTQVINCNDVLYTAAGSRFQGSAEVQFDDGFFMGMFSPTQTYNAPDGLPIVAAQLTGGANYGFVPSDTVIYDTVSIVNGIGTQALIFRSISFGGLDKDEFVVTPLFDYPADPFGEFQPFVLPPGDSLKFAVVFTPNDATDKEAYFEVEHSGPNSPERVYLTAESCFGETLTGGGDYTETSGMLMMETESEGPNGWTVNFGGGMTYYTWEGGDYWGGGDAGNFGYLSYPFEISTAGTYRFQMHSLQGNFANPDAEDDVWINFPGASWVTTVGGGTVPLNGYTKIYQNDVSGWSWETYAQFDGSEIYVTFPAAGIYNLEMSGRSNGFSVDRFVLYMGSLDPNTLAESPRGSEICINDWYFDGDLDGFGNPLISIQSADPVAGYVGNNSDCNDADPNINPNTIDADDGLDNNCDGLADEGWVGQCDTLRINCGSDSAFVDALGNVFGADNFSYYSASVPFSNDTLTIINTMDTALYLNERTALPGELSFSYRFPVVNGTYEVRLHFAEIYHGIAAGTGDGIGNRLINVSIEGIARLTNYDIVLEAGGPATAIIVDSIMVDVIDNQLDIDFSAFADKPKISAIEIFPTSGCGRGGLLPVEFVDFQAKLVGQQVELHWATASEVNNDYFLLERAGADRFFSGIAQVASQGDGNELRIYRSTDYDPLDGINYYRLKQVDLDGQFSYSSIVEVINHQENIRLFPNPVRKDQGLTLKIASERATEIHIKLFSLQGQELMQTSILAEAGTQNYEISTTKLAAGTYLLLINNKTHQSMHKIIVLE